MTPVGFAVLGPLAVCVGLYAMHGEFAAASHSSQVGRFTVPGLAAGAGDATHLVDAPTFLSSANARVIEGDTLMIGTIRVRLRGINAPEPDAICKDAVGADYACGLDSMKALRQHIANRTVRCRPHGQDAWSRIVATCFAGGRDIADYLVRHGRAFAYGRHGYAYLEAQDHAGRMGAGLWQVPAISLAGWQLSQTSFEEPGR